MGAALPAAITAAGALAGGALSAHSSSKAAKTQAEANDKALQFEREQAAEDKRRYDEQIAAQKAQWDAYQAAMEPYRQISAGIGAQTAARLGLPAYKAPSAPQFVPGMTAPSGSSIGRLAGIPTPNQDMLPVSLDTAPKFTVGDILNNAWAVRKA